MANNGHTFLNLFMPEAYSLASYSNNNTRR